MYDFLEDCTICTTKHCERHVLELPKLFQHIRGFERLLASRRILFKNVTVMPKDKTLKIKRSVCNIPVSEVDVNCNMLLRQ